ncbi:EAL domain-containing protein [Bacillus tuaregi]|uniref:EAL domain-containing protein n=1 Tax=Bacillus tuaregi TaxID=1816695 RepID=UPI0008F7EFD5|nr:EAL domain-containing protein [Bacillus tuaregi]
MANESLDIKDLVQENEIYTLIDELKMGVYLFDDSGESLWGNQYFQSMMGYSLEQLKSTTLYDLFSTQDAQVLLEKGKQGNYTLLGKRRGSQHILYLELLSCIKKAGLGTIVKVVDITEQKLSDYQLSKTYKELEDFKYALDQSATVSITDANGKIFYVNDKFCETSQYDRSELIGQNHRIVKSDYHSKEDFEKLWRTISSGKVWSGEVCNRAKDGSHWWGDATIVPLLDEEGKPYQYIGIRSDITDKKAMQEKIKKTNEQIQLSENRFRSLVEHSNDLIALLNAQGIVEYISPNFENIIETNMHDILGKSGFDFVHHDDFPLVKDYFEAVVKKTQRKHSIEVRFRDKSSIRMGELIMINLLDNPAVKAIKVNIRDITEKKKHEKQIFEMSNYDFLTKLPNSQLFRSIVKKELEHAKEIERKFSLVVLDFHGLRFVNNTLGAHMGDLLLQEAAKRLQEFIGEMGIVSRYGGSEFNILLPNMANHVIRRMSKDIIHLFEQPFLIREYELFFTVNIGVSIYPDSGESVPSLMQHAYSALHQANESGPNNYQIYSEKMDIHTYKRFTLNNDLRKAVKNNEFFIDFQPRIEVKSNRIIGAEALIRWNHPKWGIVSPKEFISLAEKSGLIGALGEIVLLGACQQMKKWQDMGLPPIKVSVNFSVLQFLQTDVIEMVEAVLERTGIEAKWLEIEITESVFMENEAMILEKIAQLKRMGIWIAIDDFGTGFSSLGYLKKMQADVIKIDRSFIKGIPEDADSIDIVSAVIQLSKKLKLHFVAEGVETEEQLRFLKKLHCEEIQGYLYSKPLEVEKFEALLKVGVCLPIEKAQELQSHFQNRREYFRINLKYPLCGDMTISVFDGKKVNLGSTKILILDIGPGGLKVETTVKLPVRSDMILKFSTNILGGKLELQGKVVWRKEIDDHDQLYGISLIINDDARKHLTSLLNHLQIKLQEKDLLSNCSFMIEDKHSFFENV